MVNFPKALDFDVIMANFEKPDFLRNEYNLLCDSESEYCNVVAMGLLARSYCWTDDNLNKISLHNPFKEWAGQLGDEQIGALEMHIKLMAGHCVMDMRESIHNMELVRYTRDEMQSVYYILALLGKHGGIAGYLEEVDRVYKEEFGGVILEGNELFRYLGVNEPRSWWLR